MSVARRVYVEVEVEVNYNAKGSDAILKSHQMEGRCRFSYAFIIHLPVLHLIFQFDVQLSLRHQQARLPASTQLEPGTAVNKAVF